MKENVNKKIVQKLKEGVLLIKEALPSGKPQSTTVVFDKSTNPFEVHFSERGFEISEERFSFDFIETALSKNIIITLDNGSGLVLDRIKMDKILKYKDLY